MAAAPASPLPASAPLGPAALGLVGTTGTRTTLLLAMAPGHAGIRRFNPSADPILCIDGTCWVSRGPDQDAKQLPRSRALGAINTLGMRAGACSNSLTCVFRNVDLGGGAALVQPIDLRLVKHDKREAGEARIDPTCRLERTRLTCGQEVRGPNWRLWVVPEGVAATAGATSLAAAVQSGLSWSR